MGQYAAHGTGYRRDRLNRAAHTSFATNDGPHGVRPLQRHYPARNPELETHNT